MTLVLVALCLLVFMGIAALAVDVGVMYTARTSAQHAADAGALAGAFAYVTQSGAVKEKAVAVANQNNVLGTPAGITTNDVSLSSGCSYSPGTGNDCLVTVQVPRTASRGNPVSLYFARALGWVSADIIATATAEALPYPTGSRCVRPIFIPNTAISKLGKVTDACNSGQFLINPSNGSLTSYGQSQVGQSFLLKDNQGNQNWGALPPSQWAELDFGNGSNSYRCLWSSCLTDPTCQADPSIVPNSEIQCAAYYPIKTGNSVGPTIQGVNTLIGNPPDQWTSTWTPTNEVYYDPSTQTNVATSPSLTIAPVWDDCAYQVQPGTTSQQAQVIGFVEIFIDSANAQGVTAHLVNTLGCLNGSGGTSGTGPLAIPVRLVQTP